MMHVIGYYSDDAFHRIAHAFFCKDRCISDTLPVTTFMTHAMREERGERREERGERRAKSASRAVLLPYSCIYREERGESEEPREYGGESEEPREYGSVSTVLLHLFHGVQGLVPVADHGACVDEGVVCDLVWVVAC